jgi:hypothetical protein
MEVSVQLRAPADLPPGKELTQYHLDRRLGGPQSWSGRYGEENTLATALNLTPAVQPVARRYIG